MKNGTYILISWYISEWYLRPKFSSQKASGIGKLSSKMVFSRNAWELLLKISIQYLSHYLPHQQGFPFWFCINLIFHHTVVVGKRGPLRQVRVIFRRSPPSPTTVMCRRWRKIAGNVLKCRKWLIQLLVSSKSTMSVL